MLLDCERCSSHRSRVPHQSDGTSRLGEIVAEMQVLCFVCLGLLRHCPEDDRGVDSVLFFTRQTL